MNDATRTDFRLAAIDGNPHARRYLAGYETAEADFRRRGRFFAPTARDHKTWAQGYRAAMRTV